MHNFKYENLHKRVDITQVDLQFQAGKVKKQKKNSF